MNRRQFGRIAVAAAALPFPSALAQRVDKNAEQLTNGEFNWYPDRSTSGPTDTQGIPSPPIGMGRIVFLSGMTYAASPWHPTARLINQRGSGDWSAVIEDVREALSAWTADARG